MTVDTARARWQDALRDAGSPRTTQPTTVALGDALGRVLAEPLRVPLAVPGELVPGNELLLSTGTEIGPFQVAIAAASGYATLTVMRAPLVVILPTGDNLRAVDDAVAAGDRIDAISPLLAAHVVRSGAEPAVRMVCPDDPALLRELLRIEAARADVVIVGLGARTTVSDVLAELGEVVVSHVAAEPLQAVQLAVIGDTPVIGVPDHPVFAAVAAMIFLEPVLLGLRGVRSPRVTRRRISLVATVFAHPEHDLYVPVALINGDRAAPLATVGQAFAGFADANALLRVPAGVDLAAGELADVELFAALSSSVNPL